MPQLDHGCHASHTTWTSRLHCRLQLTACCQPVCRSTNTSRSTQPHHKFTFGRAPVASAGAAPCSPPPPPGWPAATWTSAPAAAGWAAGPDAAAAAALGRLMAVSRAAATSRAAACGPRPPEPLRWPAKQGRIHAVATRGCSYQLAKERRSTCVARVHTAPSTQQDCTAT